MLTTEKAKKLKEEKIETAPIDIVTSTSISDDWATPLPHAQWVPSPGEPAAMTATQTDAAARTTLSWG